MRFFVSCLLLLGGAHVAFAKVEIRNIQPAHGLLGPARANDDVYPLDEYLVRYQVSGVKVDAEGKVDLEVGARLTNSEGKTLLDTKGTVQRALLLGGNVVQTFGLITFPEKAPPGAYKLTITVRDRLAAESASFERQLNCKATTFQLLMPRFTRDADGKVPAGTTAFVGESITFKCRVVGFDRSQKKVALVMKVQFRDADDKEILAKPVIVNGDITDPEKVSKTSQANFSTTLYLHRGGDFKMIVTVEDTIAKKTTTFETPFKVLAP